MTDPLDRWRFRRDHRWAPGHMSDYLDGALGSRSRARMERHSAECPDCRRVLHSLRRMLGLLHGLPGASSQAGTPDIALAVRARLHERSDG